MTYGRIWPAHPKPLPDELLSSWIVRVAKANGIKLQTLCWMLFGNGKSPWNRDIDRSAPHWLLHALSQHTGTNYWDIFHTTLATYRTRLYSRRQSSGQLRWILPVNNYGMRRTGFGQQFCPLCLTSDPVPYYRKQWRVALFTYCPQHQVLLWNSCPACGLPVMHYRGDFGRELREARPMHTCHACGFDFREAEGREVFFPDEEVRSLFDAMLLSLGQPTLEAGRFDLGFFAVLHQLCLMLEAIPNHGKLQHFVAKQLGLPVLLLPTKRLTVEQRSQTERHQVLLCGLWLMGNLTLRLGDAWSAKAVRYNLMLKDLDQVPMWYRAVTERFSSWHDIKKHIRSNI